MDGFVEVPCKECGKLFNITYRTYKEKKEKVWTCKDCRAKVASERQKNMSPEKKRQLSEKCKSNWKNKSQEEKDAHSQRTRDMWANKSEEELKAISDKRKASISEETKAKLIEIRRINTTKRMHSMTDEEKKDFSDKISKSLKKYYSNISDEERAKISEQKKEYYANLSDEDKEIKRQKAIDGWNNIPKDIKNELSEKARIRALKMWENMDPTKRREISEKCRESGKKWWNSLSEEEQEKWKKLLYDEHKKWWESLSPDDYKNWKNSIKEFWDNITPEEFEDWLLKRNYGFHKYMEDINNIVNQSELNFIQLLLNNNIDFSVHCYNQIKHPDFDKLFPINPNNPNVKVSPFREWDFQIHTLNKDIFIDIDGSIHRPDLDFIVTYYDGTKASIRSIVDFNDSKRLYQTDGLDAYVVQCYDDNLTLDTPVVNIKNGNIFKVSNLIDIFKFENIAKKELDKIINKMQI